MKYYEIWFYFYGEGNPKTDMTKEFTFYCKTETPISSDDEMIAYLKSTFPVCEKYHNDQINCIDERHFAHMSKWFEISAEEFEDGCSIPA